MEMILKPFRSLKELLSKVEEKDIDYKAEVHWIVYLIPILIIPLALILSLAYYTYALMYMFYPTFLILLWQIRKVLINLSINIFIKDNQLTFRKGVINKTVFDISLKKYEGIYISQNLLGRILNYGTLTVSTGEISGSFKIKKPNELRKVILEKTLN